MNKPFFLSTPIFYPNAKLHLGHAYTTTLADSIVRYQRMIGTETYFLTGSDENTQKMVDAAKVAGQTPLDYLHDIINKFDGLFRELDISFDQFIRTTDQEKHWKGAQELWKRLDASGDIYQKAYEGLYCVGHEAFITEKDLVDGKCPDHGTVPQFLKETNYFFRLSKYTAAIKEKIESDEIHIVPASRKNEILALLNEGLEDVSFSRPRKPEWPDSLGIPVPGDSSQVIYVWCDALSNYITALGFGREDDSLYQKFWPGMHVIGKDILRFHAAIWPGMLLSAGLPLPHTLLVHGFITSGGKKMSKSLGNVIDPEELIEEYGAEAVRYYLVRHITPHDDGDITRESFKDAYNADLANGLGNLAARIMTLAEKNLPAPIERPEPVGFPKEYTDAFEQFRPDLAAAYVWQRIAALDQKIAETEPFKVVKSDPEKGKAMIAEMAAELYAIARMLNPIMPMTSHTIKQAILANKKPDNLFARKD